jgi:hypothetical protein
LQVARFAADAVEAPAVVGALYKEEAIAIRQDADCTAEQPGRVRAYAKFFARRGPRANELACYAKDDTAVACAQRRPRRK